MQGLRRKRNPLQRGKVLRALRCSCASQVRAAARLQRLRSALSALRAGRSGSVRRSASARGLTPHQERRAGIRDFLGLAFSSVYDCTVVRDEEHALKGNVQTFSNQAAAVDAPIASVLHLVHFRRRATAQRR
jgi:hypothetical protein